MLNLKDKLSVNKYNMNDRQIVAIELGSYCVRLAVATINANDQIEDIVYYAQERAQGIRNSLVNKVRLLKPILHKMITECENKLNIKITQVIINHSRHNIKSIIQKESINLHTDKTITDDTIDSLMSQIQIHVDNFLDSKYKIYASEVIDYTTDNFINGRKEDILDTKSNKLELNTILYYGERQSIDEITQIFNELNISIAEQHFCPISYKDNILKYNEQINGVAVIDIGHECTSISIFYNNALCYYNSIAFGGRHTSMDINLEQNIKEELADNIKKAYGECQYKKYTEIGTKFLDIKDKYDNLIVKLRVSHLNKIISARLKEIIYACLYYIEQSTYADKIQNIVLIGGEANISNIDKLCTALSGYPCDIRSYHLDFNYEEDSTFKTASKVNILSLLKKASEIRVLNSVQSIAYNKSESNEETEDIISDELFSTESIDKSDSSEEMDSEELENDTKTTEEIKVEINIKEEEKETQSTEEVNIDNSTNIAEDKEDSIQSPNKNVSSKPKKLFNNLLSGIKEIIQEAKEAGDESNYKD